MDKIKYTLIGQEPHWWEKLGLHDGETILSYGKPDPFSPRFLMNDTYHCSSDKPECSGEIDTEE